METCQINGKTDMAAPVQLHVIISYFILFLFQTVFRILLLILFGDFNHLIVADTCKYKTHRAENIYEL